MTIIVEVRKNSVWIAGKRFPLDAYVFEPKFWRGANGVVFKAKSELLNRIEAVKVWLPREDDPRTKLKQGSFEAQKQAASAFNNPKFRIINIFHAAILDGYFFATMEFFEGPNLREWIKTASLKDRWCVAHVYIEAMHHTSNPNLFHGDPHSGNILINENEIAICDYGTSYGSTREYGWARHWKKVDETTTELLLDFDNFKYWRSQWPDKNAEGVFSAYRDVLRALTEELFQKTDGTIDEVKEPQRSLWQYSL